MGHADPGFVQHMIDAMNARRGSTARDSGASSYPRVQHGSLGHRASARGERPRNRSRDRSGSLSLPGVPASSLGDPLTTRSARKMIKRRNIVNFRDGGGTIRNRTTGKVFRFYEHDGVYFLKLKTSGPDSDLADAGFHRQGRR